jgi:hypothetical protein
MIPKLQKIDDVFKLWNIFFNKWIPSCVHLRFFEDKRKALIFLLPLYER